MLESATLGKGGMGWERALAWSREYLYPCSVGWRLMADT